MSASRAAVALLAVLLNAQPLVARGQDLPPAPPRPRIGLVLGGGGAKGAAHIGVLRVLEEMHIPVSCVTGTSMGALVGATFAGGMPAEEIEKRVLAINWATTVGSAGLRERTPIHRKLDGITYTNKVEFGLKDGRLRAPPGLLQSQNIEDVIRSLVADVRDTHNFNDLPIPFRAVATDMLQGRMVVLDQGDISVAMRASMAVPGAFSPVVIDGMVLSDGGMMRNLPVDIARNLCADVVIAVSLSSTSPKAEDLFSPVALAARSLEVMIGANQAAQIATLTADDVSIVVPMGDIGSGDFDRVPDAIPLGREAALGMQAQLSRYSIPEAEYAAWREEIHAEAPKPIRLAKVEIKGLERVNKEYVASQIEESRPGREVTTADIVSDTGRIFALGDFERVEYDLSGPPDAAELDITAIEKSWGPTYARFDLGLGTTVGGNFQFVLRGDVNRTWINSLGAQWRGALQVGTTSLLETDFYQPLDTRQVFFVDTSASYARSREDLYIGSDQVATYEFVKPYAQVDLGMNLGSRSEIRAGVRHGWPNATVDTGAPLFPAVDTTVDSAFVTSVVYDTRDAAAQASSGSLAIMQLVSSGSFLGGENDYGQIEGIVLRNFSWRGDTIGVYAMGGDRLSGTLPATQLFQLGGIRSFPGLESGQLRGNQYWTAGGNYSWRIADIASLFNQALYAGIRLYLGRMGDPIDDVRQGVLQGAAATLSGRTPLGPLQLSAGFVSNGDWELQLGIGRPINEGTILDNLR